MKLNDGQIDALRELISIGVGRAAGALNEMIGAPIRIVINGVMGSIANVLHEQLRYDVPIYQEGTIERFLSEHNQRDDDIVLIAQTGFEVEQEQVKGDVLVFFEAGSFDALMAAIDVLLTQQVGAS